MGRPRGGGAARALGQRPPTAGLPRLPQGPPGDIGFKGIQGPRGPPGLMVSPLPVCPSMASHPRQASHQLGDVTLPDPSVLSPLCPLSPLLEYQPSPHPLTNSSDHLRPSEKTDASSAPVPRRTPSVSDRSLRGRRGRHRRAMLPAPLLGTGKHPPGPKAAGETQKGHAAGPPPLNGEAPTWS